MSKVHQIKAFLAADSYDSSIEIDGKRLDGVTHFAVSVGVGEPAKATIAFTVFADVEVDGAVRELEVKRQ